LERGRTSGELTVSDQGFRFRGDRAEFFLPLNRAKLSIGGASDRLIFIAHPNEPDLSIYTSDRTILHDPVLISHPELVDSLRIMRNKRIRNWSVLTAVCLLLIATPLAFVLNIDYFAALAVRQIPYSWEEQLGKTALGQIQVQSTFMPAEQSDPLLKELTAPLIEALGESPYRFHFYVANEKSINAFALPGGYIVIHSELLLRAESAEELLGVLAHEIAHVTERHGTRGIVAKSGAWLVFQAVIGDAGGILTTLGAAAPFLLSQNYSRGFETDADEQGYVLLDRAHVDAAGMAAFFGKIRDEEAAVRKKTAEQLGEKSADVLSDVPEFLRTHPLTEKRIAHIKKLAAEQQGPYRNLERPFAQLKDRVRAFATHAPDADDSTTDRPPTDKVPTNIVQTDLPTAASSTSPADPSERNP
jgi:Zn-dependent protease with chaperone function